MRALVSLVAFGVVAGAALAAACHVTKVDPAADGEEDAGSEEADASADDGINATGVGAGTGAATGLPCDVQQLLENRCIGCHLATTKYPLLSYDDLQKPAPSEPTKTMAQASLEKLQAGLMPPKPADPPAADEVEVFKVWVDAKTPKGEVCTTPPVAVDAGAKDASAPAICTSNAFWKGDEEDESPEMHPGGPCITCHSKEGGRAYRVAGTVYPTLHEPLDCNGVKTPVVVVITDARGIETKLTTNAVGNFFTTRNVKAPYKVKVVANGKERVMAGSATAGDCNSCHTEQGVNGAPGRVMAP